MASPIAPIECGICLEVYTTTCRPRVLPCGHNFCGPCLQNCLSQSVNKCSNCRREYIAITVNDIPINTDLEKLIHMWSVMAVNTPRTNKSSDEEDDFSQGRCSKHRQCLLYFRCKTHAIYICRECAVIQHSPSKCDIVEIKEEVMKTKEDTLKKAQHYIDHLDSVTTILETIVVKKNDSITRKKAEIECLLKEIEEESIVCCQAQKDIDENKTIARQLQGCSDRLQKETTNMKINKECYEIEDKVGTMGKQLEELEKKYFSKLLLKNPKRAAKIMQERRMAVYAVDVDGECIIRSSKILSVNGSLMLSSMEKDVSPTPNAIVIPVSSLLSAAGAQPVVYLMLEVGGRPTCCRVRILLTCGPRRREQMLRLCTAHEGSAYKGSWFDVAWDVGRAGEGIGCYSYKTPDGDRSDTLIVQDQEGDECERYVEGAVTGYVDNAGFMICTKTHESATWMGPKIGQVVSGLDLLCKVLCQYTTHDVGPFYNASQLRIAEAGVEIIDIEEEKSLYLPTSVVPRARSTQFGKVTRMSASGLDNHEFIPYSETFYSVEESLSRFGSDQGSDKSDHFLILG